MSTYCISDIHGEYERYIAMLEHIHFSDEDVIFVLGDVIDRHPRGVDILLDIMDRENVILLLGNHEKLPLDDLGPVPVYGARQLWQQNGGRRTRADLLYKRSPAVRNRILRFISSLPDHVEIAVNGRDFHLVHGMPADNQYDRIWERPTAESPAPFEDKITIVGHTPTVFLTGDTEEHYRIWHGNGIIDIDCACGNDTEKRRLACLRLDDMTEYYI